jgi:NTP pyrophosphatase (non-canonical NTP hydrolase)
MSTNWQAQVNNFTQKRNLTHPISVYALDLMSEVGEVAKEILLATDYGTHDPEFLSEDIHAELGDVLYTLCTLATAANVDLEQALTAVLEKYEKRWLEKGHMGSHS